MRNLLLTFVLLSLSLSLAEAQDETPLYARARVHFSAGHEMSQLLGMGVVCHGNHAHGRHFTSDFSYGEIQRIRQAGFRMEILIADAQRHYVEQNQSPAPRDSEDCGSGNNAASLEIPTPQNFNLGSMGGYLTYSELLAELDDMRAAYPNLISARTPISTSILTHEGREVYWLRISDNPDVEEEGEPQVLYNSLIHAREPGSMMQMVFYMWYLLENYENDPEIQYLVENTDMYFVPCINPDGYVYNETTAPNGGGLWRKNRRDNGDGSFGVDLNRNFGHSWGYDDQGSSPIPSSDTYRGPAEFSEPETQLYKMFVENHEFQIALNYHTYGKWFLRPWGHIADLPPDIATFDAFGELCVGTNGYEYGGPEVIGYFTNGDQDGWAYGAEDIISYTPEVGASFWPPSSAIEIDAKDNLPANLYVARFLLKYARGREAQNNPEELSGDGTLTFDIRRYGFREGDFEISLQSEQANVSTAPIPLSLSHLEEQSVSFDYVLNDNLVSGDEVVFELLVDNGEFPFKQSFSKVYSVQTAGLATVFSNNGDNMEGFSSDQWGVTTSRFYSEPSCISDSPAGYYPPLSNLKLELNETIDLSDATEAYVTFLAAWDIEPDYDYCQFEAASGTESTYVPQCGIYTKDASPFQPTGEPLWDGSQTSWVRECVYLTDFIGESEVSLRFELFSDDYFTGDGFFFDDFQVVVVSENVSALYFGADDFRVVSYPNPTTGMLRVEVPNTATGSDLVFYNALGQALFSRQLSLSITDLNLSHLPQGGYYYSITHPDGRKRMVKVVKQ